MSTVILLIFVVVGFIRGLERSLGVSGDPSVVLVYSLDPEENIENSAVPARTPSLLKASPDGVQQRFGVDYISPELYLGPRVQTGESDKGELSLIRGATQTAPLVLRNVRLTEGNWPCPGEVIVGKLVAAKLGCPSKDLAVGQQITIEKESWTISGRFSAGGAAYESETWCRLPDFQQALKRQDTCAVAMALTPESTSATVSLFC